MSLCQSVCLFAYPLTFLKNHTPNFTKFTTLSYMWPWLGPLLTALQYVMYFRLCG